MKTYPQELKDRLTARLLAPHNESPLCQDRCRLLFEE